MPFLRRSRRATLTLSLIHISVQGENEVGQGNVPGNTGDNGEGNEGTGDNGGGSEAPAPDPGPAPSVGLIWPISSEYHPIAWDDMFGDRIHPVYGTWTWHSGCDMAAPGGTSVWSPGDGVVTFAGWNGGYGNCIIDVYKRQRHARGGTVWRSYCSGSY